MGMLPSMPGQLEGYWTKFTDFGIGSFGSVAEWVGYLMVFVIIVLVGFIFEMWAIMRKPSK